LKLNIEVSKDGYKILKINKDNKEMYFGSKYNQKREINKFINSFKEFTEKNNYIVLGLSFGEHIKELLKLIYKGSKILIIEFNKELIEYCKKEIEINKIVLNPQVTIATNEEEIKDFVYTNINIHNVEGLSLTPYCLYDKIYKNELNNMYDLIRNMLIDIKLDRNTIRGFGEEFLDNLVSNLKYVGKATEINKIKNVYKDKPAIIVSAGPSLMKNIDKLKGVDNAVILTGGRTLGALVDMGVIPACLGVVDPGEVSYKLVENYIDKVQCPLLFKDMTNRKIVEEHKNKKIFYTENKFILELYDNNINSLYGGGSIAHTLTLFGLYMGCNPIIFIGQDLAYTEDQGHASCSGNRWEEWTFDRYKNESDIYVKDIYGKTIRASIILDQYRISLEKIIEENSEIKFINATEGGVNIKGTEIESLENVLGNLKKQEIIPLEQFLKEDDKIQLIIEKLNITLNDLKQYIKYCEDGKDLIEKCKISDNIYNRINEDVRRINEINTKISKYEMELSLFSEELTKVNYEVENNEEFIIKASDDEDIIFNKNINKLDLYYSYLMNSMKKGYVKIEKELEILNNMLY
jgi:hypothetical protein